MLPIGSIIYLKEGSRKIMILNRGPVIEENNENIFFDYSGCSYPLGLNIDEIFYFNEENVDKILFEGFSDEDEERFDELYSEYLRENKNIRKGSVQ
ncbi:DUF4176 domain-containing protein [Latilactobacillus fragifolii]|uniref:DUF4176 domain-containing protein n=1 Tax=Latilactobacillus fragifolii TaxID=2814244 RepID=UPI001ABA9665|nr:DUF4176 domain-containing protein [Latilactobacillus fragifolii]